MPLVFPIEAGFIVLVAGVGAWMLMRTETMWLRPALQGLQHPSGAWWKRLALRAAGAVVAATLFVEKSVRHALSHFAAGGLHLLTRFFAGVASMFHFLFKELGELSHATADSLAILRHETMPRAIHRSVAPVRVAATHAGALAGRAAAGERANRRSISGINRKLGALAGLLLGADLFVFGAKHGGHARLHHRHHTHTIPKAIDDITRGAQGIDRLEKTTVRHGVQIRAITKVLAGVLTGALALKMIYRVLPFTKCSSWGRLSRLIQCTHINALADLLALGVDALLLYDLCRIVGVVERAAIAFEGPLLALVNEVEGFVCGGRSAAPSGIQDSDWQAVSSRPSAT